MTIRYLLIVCKQLWSKFTLHVLALLINMNGVWGYEIVSMFYLFCLLLTKYVQVYVLFGHVTCFVCPREPGNSSGAKRECSIANNTSSASDDIMSIVI